MADFDESSEFEEGGRRRGGRREGGGGRPRGGGNRRERNTSRSRAEYCPEGKCFDYREIEQLKRFVGETGKIKPRRQTGCCARCQRELAREVKRARHLALLPYVDTND
jgi:small subunit ribosomal protein S18